MAHIDTKNGQVLYGSTVLLDCTAQWDNGTHGTASLVDADGEMLKDRDATQFTRIAAASAGANELLASKAISVVTLSAIDGLQFWFRSSIDLSAGDLQLHLDDTAACASPIEKIDLPALLKDTWYRLYLPLADPSACVDIISVGLYQITDLADANFDISYIVYQQQLTGADTFSISSTSEAVDVTDFADAGVSAFIANCKNMWSGSFTAFKDGAIELTQGTEYFMTFLELSTNAQAAWIGKAIITEISTESSVPAALKYSFSFQGNHYLQTPQG